MLKKIFIGFALFMALSLAAAWILLPRFLVPQAEAQLKNLGFDTVNISNLHLSLLGVTAGTVSLTENGQEFLAEDMSLQWQGLDPRNLDKLYIRNIVLPLNFDKDGGPLDLDLNMGTSYAPSNIRIPDIEIGTILAKARYNNQTYEITIKDTEILPQDKGYQIYFQSNLSENNFRDLVAANGSIQGSAFYKNTEHYEAALTLQDIGLSTHDTDTAPITIKGLSGDIRYLNEDTLPHPMLSVKTDAEIINIDGALFKSVQFDAEKMSTDSYHVIAQTDPDVATHMNLTAFLDLSVISAEGTFNLTSTDLSSAAQDYPQLGSPELSGALTADLDFSMTAKPDANLTNPSNWDGSAKGVLDLNGVTYNNIKNINGRIDTEYKLPANALDADFELTAGTPDLRADAALTFSPSEDHETIISGQITDISFEGSSLKNADIYATFNRENKDIAFDLKGVTLDASQRLEILPPLSGRLRGIYTAPVVSFNFQGKDISNLLKIQSNGKYDTSAQGLNISYKVVSDRSLSAADITRFAPDLRGSLNEFSGTVSVDGAGKLNNGVFTSSQDIKIDADSLIINTVEAVGIAGVIKLDTTPHIVINKEEIFVGGLDVGGLPLKGGEVEFSYNSNQNIFDIHNMKWMLAEGKITTDPFAFNTKTRNADLLLKADRINLSPLFSYMPLDGLRATGYVSGEIPVSINNGKLSVKQGYLEAVDAGDLQYDPAETPEFLKQENPYIDMVRDALKDYNYDILSLTVDGSSGENQQVILKASGRNPDFFDGRPVNLNLKVEGELEDLLKFNLGAYTLPERIKQKMTAFEE